MADRTRARQLATAAIARGDVTGWFDELYREADSGKTVVPWTDLIPHPMLVEYLERHAHHGRALVVGCGYGDDAEELSRRGLQVTAFDVSAAAVAKCQVRFPRSAVRYEVADLLYPPAIWARAFHLVVEISTLHVLPPEPRARALSNAAELVAPGGTLLVVARAREENEPTGEMPWPLTRAEMDRFRSTGLTEMSFEDLNDTEDPPVRRYRAVYFRPE